MPDPELPVPSESPAARLEQVSDIAQHALRIADKIIALGKEVADAADDVLAPFEKNQVEAPELARLRAAVKAFRTATDEGGNQGAEDGN
jgi:hypothetical protein